MVAVDIFEVPMSYSNNRYLLVTQLSLYVTLDCCPYISMNDKTSVEECLAVQYDIAPSHPAYSHMFSGAVAETC